MPLLGLLLGQSPPSLVMEKEPGLGLGHSDFLSGLCQESHKLPVPAGRISPGGGCECYKCEGSLSSVNKISVYYTPAVVFLESTHLRKYGMENHQFGDVCK